MLVGNKLGQCQNIDQLSELYDRLSWQHDFGRRATLDNHAGFLTQEDCIDRAMAIFHRKPEPAKTLQFIKTVHYVNKCTDQPTFTLTSPIQSFVTSFIRFFENLFCNWKLSLLEKRVLCAIPKEARRNKREAETQKILQGRTTPYRRPPPPLIPECYLKQPLIPPKPKPTYWVLESSLN